MALPYSELWDPQFLPTYYFARSNRGAALQIVAGKFVGLTSAAKAAAVYALDYALVARCNSTLSSEIILTFRIRSSRLGEIAGVVEAPRYRDCQLIP